MKSMTRSDGLAKITTFEEAKNAWENFFGRFFTNEIPAGVEVKFSPEQRIFAPRKNEQAKYQHPSLIAERTDHSDDFDDFLNGNTVTIPKHLNLTEEGLNQFKQALLRGDYTDPSFENNLKKDRAHVFYALWLFKQNNISRQQMSTILARAQVSARYPITETYQILNEQGEFTPDAKKKLIPILAKTVFGGPLTPKQLERFRLLILSAPKSEQIFYTSIADPQIISSDADQLGDELNKNNTWHRMRVSLFKKEDFHWSFGVTEALQIARHGVYGAAANRAKLGKVKIDVVKEGVEYYYRPTAISIENSGVEPTTEGIHSYEFTPMPAVTAHDVFHAKLHNTIPPEFNMMLNHMPQIISKHTKQKWSTSLWDIVDRGFHAFQWEKIRINSSQMGAELFTRMLAKKNPLFLYDKLSDEGVSIVWDMVNRQEIWEKLYKVDIDHLSAPFKTHIQQMKAFIPQMGNKKSTELINLKYRLFCGASSIKEFQYLVKIIDHLDTQLLTDPKQQIVFAKQKYSDEIKNQTVLKLKNYLDKEDLIITESNVRRIIPILINQYLTPRKKEDNLFAAETQKVSTQLKSIRHEDTAFKTALESSLDKFPSIFEKLCFLEKCYENILISKEYTRKHATADNLFSFLKNPLTTSQRIHVKQLQEKTREIIIDHLGSLDENDREEFQWMMQNRGSKLIQANTAQFYFHLDLPSSVTKIPSLIVELLSPKR